MTITLEVRMKSRAGQDLTQEIVITNQDAVSISGVTLKEVAETTNILDTLDRP